MNAVRHACACDRVRVVRAAARDVASDHELNTSFEHGKRLDQPYDVLLRLMVADVRNDRLLPAQTERLMLFEEDRGHAVRNDADVFIANTEVLRELSSGR